MDEIGGIKRGAKTAVEQCMAVSEGESVLVVTDPPTRDIGEALMEASSEVTESVFMEMEADEKHGEEPPGTVAAAMRESDVVFAPTKRSLTHTKARIEACEAGARVATMPGITGEIMNGAMRTDFFEVERSVNNYYDRLEGVEKVEVRSGQGTRLELDVSGRKRQKDTGVCREPGCYTNLPAGELYVSPRSGDGTLVVDGTMGGLGKLSEPVEVEFEGGGAVDISSVELEEKVTEAGECAKNLAEFGIGLNPEAELIGSVLQDEKVMGTVHVALGDDSGFGGDVDCPLHLDGVLTEATVWIDGEELVLPSP